MAKNCFNCPNYIGSNDTTRQVELYGKPTGIGSCSVRGLIIATQGMDNDDVSERARDLAANCKNYGTRSAGSDTVVLSIGVGAPPAPKVKTGVARTCRACFFYTPPKQVADRIGIGMGACAKFGKLIPELRAADIARNCGEAVRAEPDDPAAHHKALIDSLVIDPKLAQYIDPNSVPVRVNKDVIDNSQEPSTYPTDRQVLPAHDKLGIRAWRKLTQGKREVFLPVFKRDFFSPEEQAKIPATGSQEHPETYQDHQGLAFIVAALWFHLDETPALHGKAGTGKTELFRYMAWLMQLPFERISITGESEKDDLAGKFHFENNETKFKDGRIVAAWKKPNVVVLDEPNTGPPEVWQFIRPLTDNSKQLINDANEGESVERHQFAFLGMAMNPAWDHRNVGAQVIGDADGSRLMHIFVDMPPEQVERDIIKARCMIDNYEIEDAVLNSIMEIAKSIREMSDNGELPITWGVRNQIKVARATAWFPLERAYALAVLDYLEPETKAMVGEIISAHTGKRRR